MEVTLEQVRAVRDNGFVLEIPSLRLRSERTTAILGPNGSGKTTLLRFIAGLERGSGQVRVAGMLVRPRQHISFVFQEEVFLRRTVRENLELGLRLRGVDGPTRRVRVEEAAERLGVAHLLHRRADHLSGGEGRRVGLARALSLRAPLVLLDEPLAGLDERTYARLLDELPQLLAAFGATTLLVTHNRHEALRLAQDLVVVVDGKVHAAGGKREVAADPRVPEVAQVLGYSILTDSRGSIAVPPGALKSGPGEREFLLTVDDVVDLVETREIAGHIGDLRVHVALPDGDPDPRPGDGMIVHAERFSILH